MSHRPLNRRERFEIGSRKGIKRAEGIFGNTGIFPESVFERHSRKLGDTTKPCSCPMCGNPRRHFKDITIQEKKFKDVVE
jgi:hypothetical protein